LQARLFFAGDAQRYRLGVNFNQIPVNAPKCLLAATLRRSVIENALRAPPRAELP